MIGWLRWFNISWHQKKCQNSLHQWYNISWHQKDMPHFLASKVLMPRNATPAVTSAVACVCNIQLHESRLLEGEICRLIGMRWTVIQVGENSFFLEDLYLTIIWLVLELWFNPGFTDVRTPTQSKTTWMISKTISRKTVTVTFGVGLGKKGWRPAGAGYVMRKKLREKGNVARPKVRKGSWFGISEKSAWWPKISGSGGLRFLLFCLFDKTRHFQPQIQCSISETCIPKLFLWSTVLEPGILFYIFED